MLGDIRTPYALLRGSITGKEVGNFTANSDSTVEMESTIEKEKNHHAD